MYRILMNYSATFIIQFCKNYTIVMAETECVWEYKVSVSLANIGTKVFPGIFVETVQSVN